MRTDFINMGVDEQVLVDLQTVGRRDAVDGAALTGGEG